MQFVTHEMAVNFDVFGPLMESRTRGNMDSRLIITKNQSWRRNWDMKITEKLLNPSNFTSSGSKSTILSFSGAARNSGLFLGLPRNKGITNEDI